MTRAAEAERLSFELVEDPEIIRFTHLQNSLKWRAKLTAEQYAQREWITGVESKSAKRDHENNLGLYHFVLRDLSIKSEDKFTNIVAACESRHRKGWRVEPNGEVKQVIAPCIGAVFTLPDHRKKGYAAIMISKLNEYLDKKLGKDSFTFLYSEVGEYYSKFGFKSHDVLPHHVQVPKVSLPVLDPSKYHELRVEEYSELIEQEDQLIRENLIRRAKESKKTVVSLAMDINNFTWFHERDAYIGSILRPDLVNDKFGILLKDGSNDHVIWYHDWSDKELAITRIKASSFESFKELISLTFKECKDCDLHEVIVWDSALLSEEDESLHRHSLEYLRSFEGTTTSATNPSLPAIRFSDGTTDYIWEYNEKWCWF